MRKVVVNYNGLWMLLGLVVMLSLPMVVGYFTLSPSGEQSLHADATATH